MPNEPEVAWAAFMGYLRIPAPRQLTKAAEILGKDLAQISRWATEYDWIERATARDLVPLQAALAAEVNLAERSARVVGKLLTVLEKETARTLAAQDAALSDPLSASALAHLAETVVKLQRLVSGESTENHSHRVKIDLTTVSEDTLIELKRVARRD